jgi:hypothetical protein
VLVKGYVSVGQQWLPRAFFGEKGPGLAGRSEAKTGRAQSVGDKPLLPGATTLFR